MRDLGGVNVKLQNNQTGNYRFEVKSKLFKNFEHATQKNKQT